MRSWVALIALIVVIPFRAFAAPDHVNEVRALDGKIVCLMNRDLIITQSSGPCDGYIPPADVAVGESFTANGKKRTIGVIQATRVDKNFKANGVDLKKGAWFCVAAETAADLDAGHNPNALWLYVPNCQPVSQDIGLIEPVTPAQFLQLPEDAQAIYVGGLIEGMAFVSYGNSDSSYPAWVKCVQRETLGDTTKDVVAVIRNKPNFSEGVSSAVAETLGHRCKR